MWNSKQRFVSFSLYHCEGYFMFTFDFDSCCSSRFRFISHSFRVMKFHGSSLRGEIALELAPWYSFSHSHIARSPTRKSLHAISFALCSLSCFHRGEEGSSGKFCELWMLLIMWNGSNQITWQNWVNIFLLFSLCHPIRLVFHEWNVCNYACQWRKTSELIYYENNFLPLWWTVLFFICSSSA